MFPWSKLRVGPHFYNKKWKPTEVIKQSANVVLGSPVIGEPPFFSQALHHMRVQGRGRVLVAARAYHLG